MKCDNEFVNSNMGLVISIARRFLGRGTDYEDLVQIGCVGLVKAAEKFDEKLGFKFSTYAVPVIMGEIKRYLRDNNYIKISRKLKENLLRVNKIRQNIITETGEEPKISELEQKTGLTQAEILECMDCDINLSSYDNGLEAMLAEDDTEEIVLDRIFLKELVEKLDERSREIIKLRYYSNKTQQETSEIIGVSQVQISRLEKKILGELRSLGK
ncbi:MAG: sigma-70 family RNA polymerase sigma factor [Clostridia bacterium]|nr:sigma-70 family RNA polymerase sigma factor [Clostridia bacterium]